MAMAAEEFEHPVEGFYSPDQHDHHNELTRCPIAFSKSLPTEKKKEETDQGEPFEEFDLGGKGKERKRKG
jgi:hypothetical protein